MPAFPGLDLLAVVLADDGPAAHEVTVAAFVAHVRSEGISVAALDVLADPTRPDVIRQRAFGAIHAALAARAPVEAEIASSPVGCGS